MGDKIRRISTKQYSFAGFTLVEVLVMVSIIAMFASIGIAVSREGIKSSRDKERKERLEQLKIALELYRDQNGTYPSTGGDWYSSEPTNGTWSNNSGNWIPNLAVYMGSLPRDPLGGVNTSCVGPMSSNYHRQYLYKSDGYYYIVLSYCAPERAVQTSDTHYNSNHLGSFEVCAGQYWDGATWRNACSMP